MWKQCISKIINYKFHETIRQLTSKEEEKPAPVATGATSWLFGGIDKLKGQILGSSDKDK